MSTARPTVWSWQPITAPKLRAVALPARSVAVESWNVDRGECGVISIPLRGPKLTTSSFAFLQEESPPIASVSAKRPTSSVRATASRAISAKRTRIRPPGDVIKLCDRLYYALQPPLETLLARSSLSFPQTPFSYQLDGVAFLYPRHAAILADEMGLGKTMQAIVALRLLIHAGEVRTALLICPKPLVSNWQRELTAWAPEIPVAVIEGDQTKRLWQWRDVQTTLKIANYELAVRDRELLADAGLRFDLVLLDEAQRIKNRAGATNQVVRSIARGRSWALTGTPVENSPEDLVGIFEFLAPGHLSGQMRPRSMGRAASDFVLRRTKEKVLTDLPPKLFRDAEVELTPEQRQSYTLAEERGLIQLGELGDSLAIEHVFELILRLKQICNFDPATGASAKLERLVADLEEVAASGQKAIVFSQWVTTLIGLRQRLAAFGPLEYHGQVPQRRRDAVIERFRDDPSAHVLLMSYGAGAVGLNLQFAGYVFLFDRWWNPAVEDQAISRAHRLGAAGPVTVTRFLAVETIEQRIDQILAEKRELLATMFDGLGPKQLGLTRQELLGLFRHPGSQIGRPPMNNASGDPAD